MIDWQNTQSSEAPLMKCLSDECLIDIQRGLAELPPLPLFATMAHPSSWEMYKICNRCINNCLSDLCKRWSDQIQIRRNMDASKIKKEVYKFKM